MEAAPESPTRSAETMVLCGEPCWSAQRELLWPWVSRRPAPRWSGSRSPIPAATMGDTGDVGLTQRSMRSKEWVISLIVSVAPLAAQAWNSPGTLDLVRRGVERRLAVQADSTLTSYRARAHGFVFFLAQVGEGLTQPPRLVKADQLEVEVYWQAPNRSKQVILGWRNGAFLPSDISYHRDHLGIITNNFGN